jgi:hypothetical protein
MKMKGQEPQFLTYSESHKAPHTLCKPQRPLTEELQPLLGEFHSEFVWHCSGIHKSSCNLFVQTSLGEQASSELKKYD